MRIYTDIHEAVRETERDLSEMGIIVKPNSMQNKVVKGDENYVTKELQAYGFQVVQPEITHEDELKVIEYVGKWDRDKALSIAEYIRAEHSDRTSGNPLNPGGSFHYRPDIWHEYQDEQGRFHYTYAERMAVQLSHVVAILKGDSGSRQGIINIHSNIVVDDKTRQNRTGATHAQDMFATAGRGRVPCSMYYQVMIRDGKMDLIYTMRSCDFLTHFYVDLLLAIRLQRWFAWQVGVEVGKFTYFTGSLHAYAKDMNERGVF